MKVIGDTQILRRVRAGEFENIPVTLEWEITVAYKVEELYQGTNDTDDPDTCVISEHVKVLEAIGPFRVGDLLQLTEDERADLEHEELQNQ